MLSILMVKLLKEYLVKIMFLNSLLTYKSMKNYIPYIFVVLLLGTFSGLLMSMGSNILASVGMMSLFWAAMLAPTLVSK